MLPGFVGGIFLRESGIFSGEKIFATCLVTEKNSSCKSIFDELPEGDVKNSQAETTLAKNILNWKYVAELEEGLSTLF